MVAMKRKRKSRAGLDDLFAQLGVTHDAITEI